MRKLALILLLMSACLTQLLAQVIIRPNTRNVSMDEALNLATSQYESKSVDVFLKEDSASWIFFVDEEPMKGWEHACCLKTVPKTVNSLTLQVPITTLNLRIPPKGNFIPVAVTNRYGTNANHKPRIAKKNLSTVERNAAKRTYAIILSGGICPVANAERYWNDCSFIYQTLVNTYGVPKANIYPIISDGTDPGEDMMKPDGTFVSSPLDLDFDGLPDIYGNARRETIENALNELKIRMNESDQLFFYVIDHGSKGDLKTQSYINLWDRQELYDDEVANWTKPLLDKGVFANFVFGQCFSGGFIDDLTKIGCVVATASNYDEPSHAWSAFPYDEFVYHWTCAINGNTPFGNKVNADYDNNGRISMDEAFRYAKINDSCKPSENPQYVSTPIYLGKDIAFNYLPANGPDLFIQDNTEDYGLEPNTTTDVHWDSPAIWIRKYNDEIEEHQNPEFRADSETVYVYVKVTNRGTKPSTGNDYIHLYWADASTAISKEVWIGMETNTNHHYTGGEAGRYNIPAIQPGETVIIPVKWIWQDDQRLQELEENECHHFCLSAKISDIPYQEPYNDNMTFNAGDLKTIAQKNLTVLLLHNKTLSVDAVVYVRNIENLQKKYSLEIRERKPIGAMSISKGIYDVASVNLTMSQLIYDAWNRGGRRVKGLNMPTSTTPQTVTFTSNNDMLQDLTLNPSEFEKVTLTVQFKDGLIKQGKSYKFDLIQRDENGKIIGGETFTINEGIGSINPPIIINPTPGDNGEIVLNAKTSEEIISLTWTDKFNNSIGEGNYITVKPTRKNDTFTVVASNTDGEFTEGCITLEPTIGIKSISNTSDKNNLDIELFSATESENSEIVISAINQIEVQPIRKNLANSTKHICVDASKLPEGLYIATLIIDGNAVDFIKFNKQ